MKQSNLKLSIVIPTFNRNKDLMRLLKSINDSALQGLTLEVIIVDNANDNSLQKSLAGFRYNFKIKLSTQLNNLYSGGARQIGLQLSKYPYVLFIDDDNYLNKTAITSLIKYMADHDDVAIVAPLMCFYGNKKIVWCAGGKVSSLGQINYLYAHQDKNEIKTKVIEDIDFFPNAFMVSKVKLDEIRFDDSNLPHNWNETDFCFQLHSKGRLVTLTEAITYHDIEYHGKITRIGVFQTYDQARSRIIFRKKHMNNMCAWLTFLTLVFPVSSIYYFKCFMNQKDVPVLILIKSYLSGTVSGFRSKIHA